VRQQCGYDINESDEGGGRGKEIKRRGRTSWQAVSKTSKQGIICKRRRLWQFVLISRDYAVSIYGPYFSPD
jgi:hypothetical protein